MVENYFLKSEGGTTTPIEGDSLENNVPCPDPIEEQEATNQESFAAFNQSRSSGGRKKEG